jgi:hypothetical protein
MNSSARPAREPDQGADAPTPEQAQRIEGFESPIAKLRREMPHLDHILPKEGP